MHQVSQQARRQEILALMNHLLTLLDNFSTSCCSICSCLPCHPTYRMPWLDLMPSTWRPLVTNLMLLCHAQATRVHLSAMFLLWSWLMMTYSLQIALLLSTNSINGIIGMDTIHAPVHALLLLLMPCLPKGPEFLPHMLRTLSPSLQPPCSWIQENAPLSPRQQ